MFFVIGILLLVNVVENVNRSSILKNELKQYQTELENLKAENTSLSSEISKLNDVNYVESYARANLMLSKEDEKIFYLPSIDK